VRTGAILANSLYDGETYDARLHPTGWSEPGFDDTGSSPAETVARDLDTLVAPDAPPIRRIEGLAPVASSPHRPVRRSSTSARTGPAGSGSPFVARPGRR
jgi:hypothetical protein